MRFDTGAGDFALSIQEESVQLLRGMGTICLQMGLKVKAPDPTTEGRRLLALQVDLYGTGQPYQRTLIGRVTEMLPFSPKIGAASTVLKFLLTPAQLHAVNEARLGGDLRMELEITGTLPQARRLPREHDGGIAFQRCQEPLDRSDQRTRSFRRLRDAGPVPSSGRPPRG